MTARLASPRHSTSCRPSRASAWAAGSCALAAVLSATLLLVSCGAPRAVVETWPSGQVKRQGQLESGMQSGEWTYWFADGAKQAKGGWQNDKQFGEWTWWFPNGQIQQTGSYAPGGKRTGHWRQFHENGQLASEGDYDRDRQDGLWRYRFADGASFAEGFFDFGVKSGLWRTWNRDGTMKSQADYFLGLKVGRWPDAFGEGAAATDLGVPKGFVATTVVADDKRLGWAMSRAAASAHATQLASFPLRGVDGTVILTGADGALRFATALASRGQAAAWYPDGKLALAGRSLDGRKDGHWRYWHDNGQLAVDAIYHDDALQSWSTFKPDGTVWQASLPGASAEVAPAASEGAEGAETSPRELIATLDRRFAELRLAPGASADGPLAAILPEVADRKAVDEVDKQHDAVEKDAGVADEPQAAKAGDAAGETGALPPGGLRAATAPDVTEAAGAPAPATLALAARVAAPIATNAAQFENALPDPSEPSLSPIQILPAFWTKAEEGKIASFIDRYSTGSVSEAADDPYAVDATVPAQRPDLIGKPLAQTRFLSADGTVIDLGAYAKSKKPVVVVVLRGFAGQVCLYCAAQTAALCNRIGDFRKAGAEVVVIYPGPAEAAPAFVQAVQSLRKDPPPMPVALDVSLLLVRALGIEDNLSRPTSLVLDGAGKVRYAYVGKTIADRPSADDLLHEVDKLVR